MLLLIPDLLMLGCLRDPRVGAYGYNLGHTYVVPITLSGIYATSGIFVLLPIAIIRVAHISMDRTFRLGLKFETRFKET